MAASDMMSALMELCQEKHIDQLYLIDRLEQSLAKSYAEILHLEWGAKVTIDRTTGKIYEATAARIFGVPFDSIVKGNPNYKYRQRGQSGNARPVGYQGRWWAL